MERKKATDFPPEVLRLFDGYVHGFISRRDFLDGAARFAVGGFTAAAMLESLRPNYAFAQQVAKNDPRIKTEYVTYPSPQGSGTMRGYLARPTGASGKLPAVVVIHENRGLNPYIEDVARRLAVEGYLAFAPDALTHLETCVDGRPTLLSFDGTDHSIRPLGGSSHEPEQKDRRRA